MINSFLIDKEKLNIKYVKKKNDDIIKNRIFEKKNRKFKTIKK